MDNSLLHHTPSSEGRGSLVNKAVASKIRGPVSLLHPRAVSHLRRLTYAVSFFFQYLCSNDPLLPAHYIDVSQLNSFDAQKQAFQQSRLKILFATSMVVIMIFLKR